MDSFNPVLIKIVALLLLFSLNSSATSYVHGPTGVIARINETNITYYHSDHLGSTTAITNEVGEVVEEQRNLPFGELIQGSERYGFTGKELDETGLQYFGARYYLPKTGKFITSDAAKDGMNWYSYAANNPLKFVDPTGNMVDKSIFLEDKEGIWVSYGPPTEGNMWYIAPDRNLMHVSINLFFGEERYWYVFGRNPETREFALLDFYNPRRKIPTTPISDEYTLEEKVMSSQSHEDATSHHILSVHRIGDKFFVSAGEKYVLSSGEEVWRYREVLEFSFLNKKTIIGRKAFRYYNTGSIVVIDKVDLETKKRSKDQYKSYPDIDPAGIWSIGQLKTREEKRTGGTKLKKGMWSKMFRWMFRRDPPEPMASTIRTFYSNSDNKE